MKILCVGPLGTTELRYTHFRMALCLITKQRIQSLLGIVHSCTVSTVIVWFNFKPPVSE